MKLDSVIVNIDLACLLGGMDSAAILQHFRYWTNINATDKNMVRDGRVWVFASRKAIQNVFPCITDQRIRTILDKLVEGGYLIKGEYSLSMTSKATWYSLSDMAKSLFDGVSAPLVNSTNGLVKTTNDINNKEKNTLTIEDKIARFKNSCEKYVEKYGRDIVDEFFNHYAQVCPNGELLCERKRRVDGAFDVGRRLSTWATNERKWSEGRRGTYQTPQPSQQPKPQKPKKTPWEEMGLSKEEYVELTNGGFIK